MISRFFIVLLIGIIGLTAVFFLPQDPKIQEPAYHKDMPLSVDSGYWQHGYAITPAKKELDILSADTDFQRFHYYRRIEGELHDVLTVGRVQSGNDPTNSIHRPERCLPAQGFKLDEQKTIFAKLPNGKVLPVRKLACSKYFEGSEGKEGKVVRSLQYYFFVGHDFVTANHFRRTAKDGLDRLLKGSNQRWGYFTTTAYLDYAPDFEKDTPVKIRKLTEAEADVLVLDFLGHFAEETLINEQITEWAPN